jgi:hypothetical protein
VIGFFVLLAVLGWHPNEPHKAKKAEFPAKVSTAVRNEAYSAGV